ncbi:MAG: acyl-CoA dehydrogenase family protein [Pseudomonadota bacterium]
MRPSAGANQSPYFVGHNAYTSDPVLVNLTQGAGQGAVNALAAHGQWVGSVEAYELARLANRDAPRLVTYDPKGERVDRVEFHPAYHALMRHSVDIGLHCSIWDEGEKERGNRNLLRAARFMMSSGTEAGHLCPITMTNASIAALMASPNHLKEWLPRVRARQYDSSNRPAQGKKSVTLGMGMTERQGGTDVRTNTTKAERLSDGLWRINGQKWFFSAPMCDAFLVLAQTASGLSCFLLPRILPDGSLNGLQLQRLKDKLGNRSNASSEVHFVNALGQLVGEEGKGIATILEMVTLTRLDCASGSAGLIRAAVAEAVFHARHRKAFGKRLIDQPLMVRVLADLSLEALGTSVLTMRLARSFDRASLDQREGAFVRLMTPAVKYLVCKTAPPSIYEAMECLGGNGYIEDGNLPRLYREAPVNAIWEGSGNVMCLDVLRVIGRNPKILDHGLDLLVEDLKPATRQIADVLRAAATAAQMDEGSARILTEQLALTAAAAEIHRLYPGPLADAYLESRLGRPWRATYGMLDQRYNARQIVDFCFPDQLAR